MSGSGDVYLTIFIIFMSGNKGIAFFAYCFFHFRRPPDVRLAFEAGERNKKFGRINAREVKRAAAEERKKTNILL